MLLRSVKYTNWVTERRAKDLISMRGKNRNIMQTKSEQLQKSVTRYGTQTLPNVLEKWAL